MSWACPLVLDGAGANHARAAAAGAHLFGHRRLVVLGKIPGLAGVGERARAVALPLLQAVEALRCVGNETRLAHLAIADDIETGIHLLPHAVGDGVTDSRGISLFVDRLAVHLVEHHFEQIVRPRQAADVGRQNAIGAQFHYPVPLRIDGGVEAYFARSPGARSMNELS